MLLGIHITPFFTKQWKTRSTQQQKIAAGMANAISSCK